MPRMDAGGPVGIALRAVRVALGLTQDEFAKRLHTSRETISAWERGHSEPSHAARPHLMRSLADAPAHVLLPLAEALYVPAPRLRLENLPPEVHGRVEYAVRTAADELNVAASSLRQSLGVFMKHLKQTDVPFEQAGTTLETWKP